MGGSRSYGGRDKRRRGVAYARPDVDVHEAGLFKMEAQGFGGEAPAMELPGINLVTVGTFDVVVDAAEVRPVTRLKQQACDAAAVGDANLGGSSGL